MTLEERISLGLDEVYKDIAGESGRQCLERIIRAAFHDIYGEKPTAWIAPCDASVCMSDAGKRAMETDDLEPTYAEVAAGFAAMRDCYLAKRTPEAA